MEFEELKSAWQQLDQRISAVEANEAIRATEHKLGRTQHAMNRFMRLVIFELAGAIVLALLIAVAWNAPGDRPSVMISTIVLQAGAALLLASAVWQLKAIRELDYAAPVLTLQRRLQTLKAHRVHVTRWTLLLSPLLWTPLAITAAHAFLGIGLTELFGLPWILANLAFGVAFVPFAIWICRGIERRWTAPWAQRIADDIAGRSLVAAIDSLGELDRFAGGR